MTFRFIKLFGQHAPREINWMKRRLYSVPRKERENYRRAAQLSLKSDKLHASSSSYWMNERRKRVRAHLTMNILEQNKVPFHCFSTPIFVAEIACITGTRNLLNDLRGGNHFFLI